MTGEDRIYRVAQWATGTVGAVALANIIRHPHYDLVGVYVYSPAKEGKDAGELCGLPETGIKATREIDEIVAARPDCVVYMPESTNFDHVARLLESGINVVTTRAEFFNPAMMQPDQREQIEAACARGNSSIHASGSSPGFITEALPIVLASITRRLDMLTIDEFANCLGGVVSEEMLTSIMGFGETPEQFAARDVGARDEVFQHSLGLIAASFGMPIDHFDVGVEWAVATKPVSIGKGTVEPGQVAAQRVVKTGYRDGNPFMRFRANWFISQDLDPAWDLPEDSGWRVQIEGDTPLDVRIGFPASPEAREIAQRGLTANRPVNAIPNICAARPGIIPTTELGQVIARYM